jgi:hypothetical protein
MLRPKAPPTTLQQTNATARAAPALLRPGTLTLASLLILGMI